MNENCVRALHELQARQCPEQCLPASAGRRGMFQLRLSTPGCRPHPSFTLATPHWTTPQPRVQVSHWPELEGEQLAVDFGAALPQALLQQLGAPNLG